MEKKRVMVCDDNPDLLQVVSLILKRENYEVIAHDNCNDICNKVEMAKPDVILMDLRIPMLGGASTTLLLKSNDKLKNIPVVLFSANTDIDLQMKFCRADGCIKKPFDVQEFLNLINGYCRPVSSIAS